VIVVGLSHRTAPIEVRERLAISKRRLAPTLERLRGTTGVAEIVLLSTCNRVEVYAAAADGANDADVESAVRAELANIGGREVMPHLHSLCGGEALRHVFRVACSLDSLVVGEPQILGQLKAAVRAASEAGTIGPALNAAMKAAVQSAKRVRRETEIGSGQVSVPTVAVDLARQIFEELEGQITLMVGAGEMAESAAKLLARAGAKVLVCNRSPERAEKLATAVGGFPVAWERLDESLVTADIVVSSTASPRYVITKKQLKGMRRKRRGRSLFLIDIAVPRDVEPAVNSLDNVYAYDVDDLSHVVAESLEGRRAEAERAEQIVLQEAGGFEERRSQLAMKPIIVALRERTRRTLLAELERSYRGRLKHLEDGDRKALSVMVDAAVNKLLHAPTRRLKQLATESNAVDAAQLMRELFDLDAPIPEAPPSLPTKPKSKDEDDDDVDAADEAPHPRAAAR
jgi:glutamyl-tRNA reductase